MIGSTNEICVCETLEKVEAELEKSLQETSSIFVLCDTNTLEHCWPLIGRFDCLKDSKIIEIEPSESSKSIEISFQLWSSLMEDGADRESTLINLGGGVVTDLGGFIASTFKRGIKFINIPTSLLAMVDASYGGKTGINLNASKNQIGTFSDPTSLIIHPNFLDTLSKPELLSGFGEMIKHGLITGGKHWNELKNIKELQLSHIKSIIPDSLKIKIDIKTKDPFEQGIRKFLNFGHTIGHAIETLSHRQNHGLKHGHAVALGMIIELKLSVKFLGLDENICVQTIDYINQFFETEIMHQFSASEIWSEVQKDKKNSHSKVLFVLLEAIGKPKFGSEITENQFLDIMKK